MFTPSVRIIIGIFGLAIAWGFYSLGYQEVALVMLSSVVLIIWGYFRNGTVYLAFKQLKQKNFDKAEKSLAVIKYPHLLSKKQKSYYHFAKGFIELNKEHPDECYHQLKLALELGLRTENDTAVATLHMADIALGRKNYDEAKEYLLSLKSLKYKPELDDEIEKVQEELERSSTNTL